MEIGKRTVGAPDLSPAPAKLWQIYRTVKNPDAERKGPQQHYGFCRPKVGFTEQAREDLAESGAFAGGKQENAAERGYAEARFVPPPRGVQSGYTIFPGAFLREPASASFEFQQIAQTLQQQQKLSICDVVKTEPDVFRTSQLLLNPDIVDLEAPAQLLAACASNVTLVPEATANPENPEKETHGFGEENAAPRKEHSPGHAEIGVTSVNVVDEEISAESLLSLSDSDESLCSEAELESAPHHPPAKAAATESLITATIMVEKDLLGRRSETGLPLSVSAVAPSPWATPEAGEAILAAARNLGTVKVEPVETKEKLITALDMLRGEALLGSIEPEVEVGKKSPPEVSKKLMTALDMFPAEAIKREDAVKLEDARETPLCEAAKLTNTFAALENVVLRVKSELVDGSLEEPATLALQGEKTSQLLKNAVKLELPAPMGGYQSGVFTDRKVFQASQMASDSEYYSTGSDDTDDAEDGALAARAQMGDGAIGFLAHKLQKVDDGGIEKKHRNSNPGRRVQGGRLYDSAFGITCHWCRQKTVEPHVKCRECTIHYCGPCLLNRNGEKIREELCDGVRWLCPKCRNGCGPGCDNCCNCGPCRKADGKTPTGQLVWAARNAQFENVHDYLVHLETGETPEVIARRKEGQDWTNCGRFECGDASEASDAGDGASSNGEGEEFTLNAETSTQLHGGKLGMKHVRKMVESQKRKRRAMRGAVQERSTQHQGSHASLPPDDVIFARLKAGGQAPASARGSEARWAPKTDEHRMVPKAEPWTEDGGLADNKRVVKREFEEMGDGGLDSEEGRAAKRAKPGEACPTASTADAARAVWYKESDVGGRIGGEQRNALLGEILSSRAALLSPFTELLDRTASNARCKEEEQTTGVDGNPSTGGDREPTATCPRRKFTSSAAAPHSQGRPPSVLDSELILQTRGASVLNGGLSPLRSQSTPEQRGTEPPGDAQGREYLKKLKSVLAEPFDAKELDESTELAACRKPLQRMRQMRGRVVDVVTEDEGLSYLDHHPDFASRLAEATIPAEKLSLLRGFFFWLQHSCMEGAFRPWGARAASKAQTGDCIETEGPECQVTAVLLQLDEGKDGAVRQKRKYTKKAQRFDKSSRENPRPHAAAALLPRPNRDALPLGANKQAENRLVQTVKARARKQTTVLSPINYRVVLCLPAPAHCKV